MMKNFSDTGFVILKNAISHKLLKSMQDDIYKNLKIKGKNNKIKYSKFCKKVKNLKVREYDFAKPLFQSLHYKGFLKNMFLEKKFHKKMVELLGQDLAFCTDPGITLNVPEKPDPKKNYTFKDWHQEIWSGASPSTVQIWTPLIHASNKYGQMQIIMDSHKWGHIPHMDRKPTTLPKKIKTKELNLNYGDVIIFSTLLLHRSLPTKSPRLSLPILTKNFKSKDSSFQDIRSFENYSFSEITKIERILGNHFLSPFRLKKI